MSGEGPGETLFSFVRHWSRRAPASDPKADDRGRLVLVCEAVHSLAERGSETTVNAVAHEVGIDQSGVSRLIRSATEEGCLTMEVSRTDGRRREASLTDEGRAMLDRAHRWQEQVFDRLTDGWSAGRRHDFHLAMRELMDRSRQGGV